LLLGKSKKIQVFINLGLIFYFERRPINEEELSKEITRGLRESFLWGWEVHVE